MRYNARLAGDGGHSKMDRLNKKRITLNDFDFGTYQYEEELPLDGEDELIRNWKGQAPVVVARRMVSEYLRRFPSPVLPNESIALTQESSAAAWHDFIVTNSRTWEALQKSLKQAARLCYGKGDHFLYWERMLTIFRLLPNRSARSKQRSFSNAKTKPPFERMGICRLCWRAVPQNHDGSFAYCKIYSDVNFGIEYKSTHNKKKRCNDAKNIRQYSLLSFSKEYDSLWSRFNPGVTINASELFDDKSHTAKFDYSLDELWNINPALIIRRLPYVYKYLFAKKTNLASSIGIVTALEMPIPKDDTIATRKLRAKFYRLARRYYCDYFEHLIWAEIWLRYEANQKGRGGARKGAGRPRKIPAESSSAPKGKAETSGRSS